MEPPRYDRLTFSIYPSPGLLRRLRGVPSTLCLKKSLIGSKLTVESVFLAPPGSPCGKPENRKAFGQLVLLGFAITDFTPAAYRRRRLRRPCMEILS